MKIIQSYSHLNGLEHILVHRPELWAELQEAISEVDAHSCRTKESKEKTKIGKILYSPADMNAEYGRLLTAKGWAKSTTSYWVTSSHQLIRKTMHMPPPEQKKQIEEAGEKPIASFNQTDFVKDRIAGEIQFGKYAFVAFDLFVKHMAFYVGDVIDVGVEIMPMKELAAEMSTGIAYYERELYNVIRQGRGVPAVPLVLIGVAP
jgi:hypothetical protein